MNTIRITIMSNIKIPEELVKGVWKNLSESVPKEGVDEPVYRY
jgi:hypothetical protein